MQISFWREIFLTVLFFCGAPVWICMCSFRYNFWEKVFFQSPHVCSTFSSWHLLTCACKWSVLLKVFPLFFDMWAHYFCLYEPLDALQSFFFEHISTFITFPLLMPLNVVLGQFGSGHKRFSTLCTNKVRHCLELTKSGAELASDVPKKSKSSLTI